MEGMDEVHDFVIVGCGGGSMCAGLVMRSAGKDVVILEKTDMVGGSTARAGGVMWIPANRFMAEDGVKDSIEQAEEYLNAVVEAQPGDAPGTSREKRRLRRVSALPTAPPPRKPVSESVVTKAVPDGTRRGFKRASALPSLAEIDAIRRLAED